MTVYAIINVAGIPSDAEALRDYLLPLGAYVGRIVGIAVLLLVFGSLMPTKARAWLWARRPWGQDSLPATDGGEGSSPPPETPTGILANIEHREGCPRNPARMETYKKIRERDGIEVTIGKCNDCAAMAYRHSADPVATPAEFVDHERRVTRGHSVLSSDDPLHAALKREREHGRQWLSGLGIAAMASPLLPHTTQDDVAGWEANVRHLLRHEPGLLTMFNYDPPESPIGRMARSATIIVSGGELGERLRRRLAQLDKAIEGL